MGAGSEALAEQFARGLLDHVDEHQGSIRRTVGH
jgi:hypothetical protein